MTGPVGTLFCGVAVSLAVLVFLRLVGKEKAHLERLILLKQLYAEKRARAKALREKLEAESSSTGP